MRFKGTFVVVAGLALGLAWAQPTHAQEQSEPPVPTEEQEQEPPAEEPSAAPDPTATEPSKMPFALYVAASYGRADLHEPINSTLVTSTRQRSDNFVNLLNNEMASLTVGWELPNKKGRFRAKWGVFSEGDYTVEMDGRAAQLQGGNINVTSNLDWWRVTIADGVLTTVRNPPTWLGDLNGNGSADASEIVYNGSDFVNQIDVADNLENRVQFIDGLYGRDWGGRRFSGSWLAGLRYANYEGNVRSGAWLDSTRPGEGYTDGSLLRLLNFRQEYTGFGPTGSMEAQFNLFDRGVQFYLKGQAALMISELSADSGDFFTFVSTQTAPMFTLAVETRLDTTRDKTTWQTMAEAGVRLNFKPGLSFEAAWQIQGFLDVVLLPDRLQIPNTPQQAEGGVSAIYTSQDLVFETVRFGMSFQF